MEVDRARSVTVPRDLAKELGRQGIRRLLMLLIEAYQDLCVRRWVKADSSEDSITEEWFIHIQERWRSSGACGLVPVHQKGDVSAGSSRGRPPTIDFCFRDKFFPDSYFGAECKLLDEKCRRHLKAYLDMTEGIGRFLTGKYAARTGAGAMVGYVRRGDCAVVAKNIGSAMSDMDGSPTLGSRLIPDFSGLYESQHDRRAGVSPFLCYHLLFAFDC